MTTLIDSDSHRYTTGAVAAIGLHAGMAMLIFLGIGRGASMIAAPAAQMVVEVAALPSAPPVPPSLAPPEPDQVKAQPKPVEVKLDFPPPPQVASAVAPAVVVPVKPRVVGNNDRNNKPADDSTHAAAPPAPAADTSRAPVIGAASTTARTAEQSWEGRVLTQLERKKRYPVEARRARREDVVYISIKLDSGGRLLDGQIRRSRGFDDLNAEVMSLIRRAGPYPAPPAELMSGRTDISLLVPVEFFLNRSVSR